MTNIQKQFQRGFTVVELLIVIVVIGILAALVLNSFAGVQAKARDTQRKTDINAIATQLEACYNDKCNGAYPTLAELTSDTFIDANLKGLDKNALRDSNNALIVSDAAANPDSSDQYQYNPTPTNCTGVAGATPCTGFQLRAYQEQAPTTPYVKDSLNK